MNRFCLLFIAALFLLLASLAQAGTANGTFIGHPVDFPHYWEGCVGSGHALLGLREDWRRQLRHAREKLGFQRIRFHAILDDDMSVYALDDMGNPMYSFFNVDHVYDYILSLGMKPIVELSFMPELLASRPNETIFHYKGGISPPKSYHAWSNLVAEFASHIVGRYGLEEVSKWDFEVWNEPNCGFWTGNQQEYFKLLQVTYIALKSVSKRLRVGGPVTCQLAWLPETIAFAESNGIQLDFLSTHIYPTDWGNDNIPQTIMLDKLGQAKSQAGKYPLYITEYNSGLYCCEHDTPYASSFIIWNMALLQKLKLDILSYWTFSDIFEEWPFKSAPFQSGFGLQTIYGVPKPAFRAFELLHRTGNLRYLLEPDGNINFLLTKNETHANALISNWNTLGAPIQTETVRIRFDPISYALHAVMERVDETHANPQATWIQQGKPLYPTQSQIEGMMRASEIVPEIIALDNTGWFIFDVPPYGIVSLTVHLD